MTAEQRGDLDAPSPAADVAAQFEWVIAHHNRAGIKGCACGWGELGKSHPLHVLAELEKADLVVTRRELP